MLLNLSETEAQALARGTVPASVRDKLASMLRPAAPIPGQTTIDDYLGGQR